MQTDVSGAVICVLAAQVANLCESFIGAAFQDQKGFEWVCLLFVPGCSFEVSGEGGALEASDTSSFFAV